MLMTCEPAAETSPVRSAPAVLVLEPVRQQMCISAVPLKPGRWTIGSSPESRLRLDLRGVGPCHGLIISDTERVVLKAWDPRTWLNGYPVRETLLQAGDRLAIGPAEFHVCAMSPAEPPGEDQPRPDSQQVHQEREELEAEWQRQALLEAALRERAQNLAAREAECEEAWKRIKQEREQLRDREAQVETGRVRLEAERQALIAEKTALAAEQEQYAARSEEISQTTETLEQWHTELDAELNRLETECRRLEEERESLRTEREWLDAEQQAFVAGKAEPTAEENEPAVTRNEQLAQPEENVEQQCKDSTAESDQAAAHDEEIAQAEARFEREREELAAEAARLETERGRLEEELELLNTERERLEEEREALIAEKAAFAAEKEQFAAQGEEFAQTSETLEQWHNELDAELNRLEAERARLEKGEEALDAERRHLDAERDALIAEKTELTTEREQAAAQREEIAQAEARFEREREELAAEEARLETERRQLEEERELLRTEREPLAAECKRLEEEAASLRAECERLEGQRESLTAGEKSQSPEAESPTADNDLDNLRSSLADMFGMSAADSPSGEHATPAASGASDAPQEQAPAPSPAAQSTRVDDAPLVEDAEDADSVAAYMERLLARTRPKGSATGGSSSYVNEPEVASAPSRSSEIDRREKSPAAALPEQTLAGSGSAAAVATPHESQVVVPPRQGEMKPLRPQDKQAVRANLDSLREVANLSARSAIATHTSKKLRSKLLVKGLLTAAAFGIALVLLVDKILFGVPNKAGGWATAAIGVILGLEMTYCALLTRRSHALKSISMSEPQPPHTPGETTGLDITGRE